MFSVVTSKFIRSGKLPSAAFPVTVIRFLTFKKTNQTKTTTNENKTGQLGFFLCLPLLTPFFQETLTHIVPGKKKGDVIENTTNFLKRLQAN